MVYFVKVEGLGPETVGVETPAHYLLRKGKVSRRKRERRGQAEQGGPLRAHDAISDDKGACLNLL